MRLLDHGRRAGYLAAWKALGLRQTYGPEISSWRRIWIQTGRRIELTTTKLLRAEKTEHRLFALFRTASQLWR